MLEKEANGFQALRRSKSSALGALVPRRSKNSTLVQRSERPWPGNACSAGAIDGVTKKKHDDTAKLSAATDVVVAVSRSRALHERALSLFSFSKPYLEILDAHAARALVVPEPLRVEPVDLDSLHWERWGGPKRRRVFFFSGDLLFREVFSFSSFPRSTRAGAPGALLRARGHAPREGEGGEPRQIERTRREKTSSLSLLSSSSNKKTGSADGVKASRRR